MTTPASALQVLAEHEALNVAQFSEFVDLCSSLLTDPNFKVSIQLAEAQMRAAGADCMQLTPLFACMQVSQQTLHALSMLVCRSPDSFKPYANSIVPLVVSECTVMEHPASLIALHPPGSPSLLLTQPTSPHRPSG